MSRAIEGKRVFLSGPMTGVEGWNRDAFDSAERELLRAGAEAVYNPARAVLPLAEGDAEWPHAACMLITLHELTSASFPGDGPPRPAYGMAVMLDGWEGSRGARAERAAAEAVGIPVVEMSRLVSPPLPLGGAL